MAVTRRAGILLDTVRRLVILTREARKERNALRDNYETMLADKEAVFDALQSERDDALARLNARLVLDEEPEITLDYFKDLP